MGPAVPGGPGNTVRTKSDGGAQKGTWSTVAVQARGVLCKTVGVYESGQSQR